MAAETWLRSTRANSVQYCLRAQLVPLVRLARMIIGWLKTIALLKKVRHRGVCKVHRIFSLACAAYNLVRMRNLSAAITTV